MTELNKDDILKFSLDNVSFKKELHKISEATLVSTSLKNITQKKTYVTMKDLTLIRSDGIQINTVADAQILDTSFVSGEIYPGATVLSDWVFFYQHLKEVDVGDKFILSTDHGDFSHISLKKYGGFWSTIFR